ncbi:MAG: bifunctional riboflavin kinase/FAD synthetase, partial [Saprospiraceae bacterium]
SLKEPHKFEYAGAAGGLMDILGYTFAIGRMLDDVEVDHHQYDVAREIFWASGAAFLVNAKMFRSLDGFDSDYFAHQEEVDLCWRIQRAGGKIWFEPKSEVFHLGGGTLGYDQPNKLFLNFKNNLSTIFKNVPYYYLIVLLPVRFILDFMIGIKYLLSGKFLHFLKIIEAYIVSILSTLYLMYKKDYTNSKIEATSIGPSSIKGILKGSLFIHYYLFDNDKASKLPPQYFN